MARGILAAPYAVSVRFCSKWVVRGQWSEVCLYDDHFVFATKPEGSGEPPEHHRVENADIADITVDRTGPLWQITLTTTSGASRTVPCPATVAAPLLLRWDTRD